MVGREAGAYEISVVRNGIVRRRLLDDRDPFRIFRRGVLRHGVWRPFLPCPFELLFCSLSSPRIVLRSIFVVGGGVTATVLIRDEEAGDEA